MTIESIAKAALKDAETYANQATMRSSAEINIIEARNALAGGDVTTTLHRAMRSLSYSVGFFSSIYKKHQHDLYCVLFPIEENPA